MRLPVPQPAPTAAPQLLLSLANRDNLRIITQTLTRKATTITTIITLGGSYPVPTPPTITSSTSVAATTTAAPPPPAHHRKGLSQGQLGAILGSVTAFLLIIVVAGFCYASMQRMPITYEEDEKCDTTAASTTTNSYVSHETRKKHHHRHHHHHGHHHHHHHRHFPKSPRSSKGSVQRPPPVAERIPGGPQYPTYRAIPIANPRSPRLGRTS